MTTIAATQPSSSSGYASEVSAPAEPPTPLPPPLLSEGGPSDALSLMLMSLERQNQVSLSTNLEDIATARDRLEELQRQLAEELKKALEAARRDREKKGGWFSRTFGSVVDAVAKVFAKHVETLKDVVVFPVDVTVSFATNLGNREALLQSLRNDLGEFSKGSETERAVEGFVSGTGKFAGDLMAFQVVLLTAVAEGAVRGDSLGEAVRERGVELWHSLETNILDNPDFWKIAERIAQAAAVAGGVASGGLLAPVVVGLVLALEADARYGFIEDAVGERAAPWVRVGLAVALAAAAGATANTGALRWLEAGASVMNGVGDAYQGIRLMQESDRRADALDRQADVQETLHRIQETQRLIQSLLALLEEKSDGRTEAYDASVRLVETQAETNSALVFQG